MSVKTELAIKIHEDIQSEIMKYYNQIGVTYQADENDPKKTIIDFFSYLYKMIPVVKRYLINCGTYVIQCAGITGHGIRGICFRCCLR